MSLQPNAIEFFETSALRGRRRSSIRPQNLLPLLFSPGGPAPNQNESAVADDPDDMLPPPLISPITDAHVSGHSLNFTTTRHHDTHSKYADTASPVTGTALPYFQAAFHLSYMTSSLLFVATMTGFTVGTFCVPSVMNFLGRFYLSSPKMAISPFSPFRIALSHISPNALGQSPTQARYYCVILASFGPPIFFVLMGAKIGLPIMFVAYVVLSSARSILTASLNVFLAELPSKPLGYAYAAWGLGAVVAPLIFQLTAGVGLPWAHFYFGSLVLAAVSAVFLGLTFVPTAQEWALDRRQALEAKNSPPSPVDSPQSGPSASLFRRVGSMPYLWALVLFALMYCGSETTTQGLIVQYLLAERNANPNTVGYVSSGFWAGETTSRLAWSFFSPRLTPTSRKYIVQSCLGVALAMQLFIWFINSEIENTVSGSLVGLFYGPLWPAILELCNDLLPEDVKMIAMAIVSAAGSAGSAVFPFMTGIVVTRFSMRFWSYITVTQTALLFAIWPLFPTRRR
ncbi:major facilitator superfamily domain-containing protein [Roridomyces roridus]|uniref:Major facilitator superfamily domain-containing protein n=1 Tax=Roridomyces roridus TaxID=1738132 RepID=A0AAD7BV32_9AGAR|nr:major facilitator superfamily domain-containing protein [Roridomyces roridus]